MLQACCRLAGCSCIVAAPLLAFQWYGYRSLCSGAAASARPDWCHSWLPGPYSHVQRKYWNVGLLRSYRLKQVGMRLDHHHRAILCMIYVMSIICSLIDPWADHVSKLPNVMRHQKMMRTAAVLGSLQTAGLQACSSWCCSAGTKRAAGSANAVAIMAGMSEGPCKCLGSDQRLLLCRWADCRWAIR